MNKMNLIRLYVVMVFSILIWSYQVLGVSLDKGAPSYSFREVWEHYINQSKSIQSQDYKLQSVKSAQNRTSRHWAPNFYLSAKTFYTNDAGSILFSKLGERNVTGQDFNPTLMNFPNASRHEKVDLGVKWMVYEGGLRSSIAEAHQMQVKAQEYEKKATVNYEYSKVAEQYGKILIYGHKKRELQPLLESITGLLKRYQIGQSSNPLGYSGLLGLKSLKNRIQGEIKMAETQIEIEKRNISERANLNSLWEAIEESPLEFVKSVVPNAVNVEKDISFSVQAQTVAAQALEKYVQVERARHLPQVGLFAENQVFNNAETTQASSYFLGAFIQWNLYDANHWGSADQAQLQALAQSYRVEKEKQDQQLATQQIQQTQKTLLEELELIEESLKMMQEQTLVSQKLFNNGLMNALQLTDVYSKRVEVIHTRAQFQEHLLQSTCQQINVSSFDVEKEIQRGEASNERK